MSALMTRMVRISSTFVVAAIISVFSFLPLHACESISPVASFRNGYHDLIDVTRPVDWQQSSDEVQQFILGHSAREIAWAFLRLGVSIEISELDRILSDAMAFSSGGISSRRLHMDRAFQNIRTLETWLIETKCYSRSGQVLPEGVKSPIAGGSGSSASRATHRSISRPQFWLSRYWVELLLLTVILMAIAMVALVSRSYSFRRRRFERLPRVPVNIPARLQVADHPPVSTKILNVSSGGLMLKWVNTEEQGVRIVLDVNDMKISGRVVWSNTHYSGIMFDKMLSEEEFGCICDVGNGRNTSVANPGKTAVQ